MFVCACVCDCDFQHLMPLIPLPVKRLYVICGHLLVRLSICLLFVGNVTVRAYAPGRAFRVLCVWLCVLMYLVYNDLSQESVSMAAVYFGAWFLLLIFPAGLVCSAPSSL